MYCSHHCVETNFFLFFSFFIIRGDVIINWFEGRDNCWFRCDSYWLYFSFPIRYLWKFSCWVDDPASFSVWRSSSCLQKGIKKRYYNCSIWNGFAYLALLFKNIVLSFLFWILIIQSQIFAYILMFFFNEFLILPSIPFGSSWRALR